jgi:hypothetical protein
VTEGPFPLLILNLDIPAANQQLELRMGQFTVPEHPYLGYEIAVFGDHPETFDREAGLYFQRGDEPPYRPYYLDLTPIRSFRSGNPIQQTLPELYEEFEFLRVVELYDLIVPTTVADTNLRPGNYFNLFLPTIIADFDLADLAEAEVLILQLWFQSGSRINYRVEIDPAARDMVLAAWRQ